MGKLLAPVMQKRYSICAAVLIVILTSCPARAFAAPTQHRQTLTASLELSQLYQPNAWQPVLLQLRNDADRAIDGFAVLPTGQAKAPVVMRLPVSVPARSVVRATVWAQFPLLVQKHKGAIPPLGVVEWRGADGALLAKAEMLGAPVGGVIDATQQSEGEADAEGLGQGGEIFLAVSEQSADADDPVHDFIALIDHLKQVQALSYTTATVEMERIPSQPAGLRPFKAILLDGVDPESLDIAQRAAVLDYLRAGGTVVVSAPPTAAGRAGQWFDELMPVRLIGTRVAKDIRTSLDKNGAAGAMTLKFRRPTTIVEAEAASGQVLLCDHDYVHVAVQPIGLGKVVFTSFPINALDEATQPQVAVLWGQLLSLDRPRWEWRQTRLDAVRHDVLGAMLGQKVAPWAVAAGIVGGYLLLVLAAQGLFRGPSRPKAFAASTVLALGFAGVLLITGMTRNRDTSLQSARLTVLDVIPGGGGWRHESVAFAGIDDPKMVLRAAGEQVFARPALADASNPPTVSEQPFTVPGAGVFPQRIERVWQASGPADLARGLRATASLGESGLALEIDNRMGQVLQSPLIVWHGRALAMDDVPPGASSVTAFRANGLGDFTNGGVLSSDEAKRRGWILAASLAPAKGVMARPEPGNEVPMLVGWLADGGTPLLGPADREVARGKSMVMVRAPMPIAPQKTGTKVSVPAALVKLDTGRMPYERDKGESVATPQPGQWLISFAAPAEVGRLRPTRATLRLRVTLPGHRLSVYKGQCADGTAKANQFSEPVAAWAHDVGAREVTMSLEPRDVDADGRVWLLIDVSPAGASAEPVSWQVKDIELSMDAEVIGPPVPIALGPATQPAEPRDDSEVK